MSIADTATGTTAHDRTFWRADYARFARAIRRTRHAMGDGHTGDIGISGLRNVIPAQVTTMITAPGAAASCSRRPRPNSSQARTSPRQRAVSIEREAWAWNHDGGRAGAP